MFGLLNKYTKRIDYKTNSWEEAKELLDYIELNPLDIGTYKIVTL